ncbi:hypothetical protein BDK51DRAFT_42997 [Blyttiomyces helicus]|uniref:Uncharacterized protein n=1 Tax=Blyttiomyces helicus TaxID=388810 RepID=A0A4P9VVV4_9FUNG|nr:hypothetical protein BDK51DRAFT_42997 [Blyttiomyces helicus]|eukprot:RKO82783.1 hypothetical protein BDK51DRAFT_42997 [Blyttiomyces helicus]
MSDSTPPPPPISNRWLSIDDPLASLIKTKQKDARLSSRLRTSRSQLFSLPRPVPQNLKRRVGHDAADSSLDDGSAMGLSGVGLSDAGSKQNSNGTTPGPSPKRKRQGKGGGASLVGRVGDEGEAELGGDGGLGEVDLGGEVAEGDANIGLDGERELALLRQDKDVRELGRGDAGSGEELGAEGLGTRGGDLGEGRGAEHDDLVALEGGGGVQAGEGEGEREGIVDVELDVALVVGRGGEAREEEQVRDDVGAERGDVDDLLGAAGDGHVDRVRDARVVRDEGREHLLRGSDGGAGGGPRAGDNAGEGAGRELGLAVADDEGAGTDGEADGVEGDGERAGVGGCGAVFEGDRELEGERGGGGASDSDGVNRDRGDRSRGDGGKGGDGGSGELHGW